MARMAIGPLDTMAMALSAQGHLCQSPFVLAFVVCAGGSHDHLVVWLERSISVAGTSWHGDTGGLCTAHTSKKRERLCRLVHLAFFSAGATIIWTVWLSMHTGWPAQPAINVSRLAPGFTPQFSALALIIALVATLAWANLVKWRAGRHQSVLWKSMALPAGGATLCWLLVMTLWLPLLDFARSYAPLVGKVRSMMGETQCVHFYGLTRAQGAAFEFHGELKLVPAPIASSEKASELASCPWLIVDTQSIPTLAKDINLTQWTQHATVRRPSDDNEDIVLYRKRPATSLTNE